MARRPVSPRADLAQLAEERGVTVSTTSRLVDRPEAGNWVTRAPSPCNGREIRVALTADGKRLLRQYDERRVDLLRDCLKRVSSDRRSDVVDALAELAHVAGS